MPGKGKTVERAYSEDGLPHGPPRSLLPRKPGLDEATALACWEARRRSTFTSTTGRTGGTCRARVCSRTPWAAIRVVKKWLSYRQKALLGRGLTGQEATEVSEMVRRIAALLLLHPALDANYAAVKAEVYLWPVTQLLVP